MGFLSRQAALTVADAAVTLPFVRWTWSGLSDKRFSEALVEFRPSDGETVREMMAGRYLLASRLIDTAGVSPFLVSVEHSEWRDALHGFAWLRHFRDVRDPGERGFARTLALDWIAHHGKFRTESWAIALTAQRVMNWLRHFPLLVDGATPEQAASIARSLRTQIQSLKLRETLTREPVEQLLATIALVGVALCEKGEGPELGRRLKRLHGHLSRQIDADGLHLSRNPRVQLDLLAELVTLRQTLARTHRDRARALGEQVDRMHRALAVLTPGTGEPAYFNGCGQVPHDLLIAVQAQGDPVRRASGTLGGYGTLLAGRSDVIADSGLVPPLPFAGEAHASALAFEFSYGTELVFGSCGPAPSVLGDEAAALREGIAHSAPTINNVSAGRIAPGGRLGGKLRPVDAAPTLTVDPAENTLVMRTESYRRRFNLALERHITLLAEGTTLVGQDRIAAAGKRSPTGTLITRFHLAPGAIVERGADEHLLEITLSDNSAWTFLWEGAELHVEESVRQSAHFGFHRTEQIVLEAPAVDGHEIAWIFTRNDGAAVPSRSRQ